MESLGTGHLLSNLEIRVAISAFLFSSLDFYLIIVPGLSAWLIAFHDCRLLVLVFVCVAYY